MPEPLKNLYTAELIESVGQEISNTYRKFDSHGFSQYVINDTWQGKELKERMRHISESLYHFLPMKYSEMLPILMQVSAKFSGFQYMFFPGFVELYGLENYEESILALEHFTQYSSSEFAVRPFIKKYSAKMMQQMNIWAVSDNYHIRRLASEGCRPRLPWAIALPDFKKDPSQILPILDKLKNDPSEYVRRSVANNLNDISKDNPQIVIEIANNWLGDKDNVNWIIKHGCRTLLKQGNPKIMTLFGFFKPEHIIIQDFYVPESVLMGEELNFSLTLTTTQEQLGKIRIEYAIDFMKKNGQRSRKVFKISESVVSGQKKSIKKSHSFKKISTRKYYEGSHNITIIINGHGLESKDFLLTK